MKFGNSAYIAIAAALAATITLGAGCSGREHDHDHEGHSHEMELAKNGEHDEHGEHHHGDGIVFPAAKAKAAGVETAVISPAPFAEVIPVSGRIISNPGGEANIAATRAGIVRMQKPWAAGMPVSAGTALFSISSAQLPEGDPAVRAKVAYQKAKIDYERASKLFVEKLATADEYQTAKTAYEAAKLAYDSYGAGSANVAITSPKGGYVLECMVKDGDFVEVGTPLMSITQSRRMRLQADLPVRELRKASEIRSANFTLSDTDLPYQLSSLNGTIISRGQASENASSFVPLIFEFDNAPGVIAGAFAEVYLLGAPEENAIAVPKSAITEEQGVNYVYIKLDDDCYAKRRVETGASDGAVVRILAGLKGGENVVVKGAINVKLASASTAIPGHTHNH